MAISPQQAYRKKKSSSEEELKHHIAEIDEMLIDGGRTYACSLFSSGFIEDHVIQEYRSAGWSVQRVGDSRDGDFLQFKDYDSYSR